MERGREVQGETKADSHAGEKEGHTRRGKVGQKGTGRDECRHQRRGSKGYAHGERGRWRERKTHTQVERMSYEGKRKEPRTKVSTDTRVGERVAERGEGSAAMGKSSYVGRTREEKKHTPQRFFLKEQTRGTNLSLNGACFFREAMCGSCGEGTFGRRAEIFTGNLSYFTGNMVFYR